MLFWTPWFWRFCFLLHWNATVFKFSRPIIFANLPGSRNSRNKGHAKKTGFTVSRYLTLFFCTYIHTSSSNCNLAVCFFIVYCTWWIGSYVCVCVCARSIMRKISSCTWRTVMKASMVNRRERAACLHGIRLTCPVVQMMYSSWPRMYCTVVIGIIFRQCHCHGGLFCVCSALDLASVIIVLLSCYRRF